MAFLILAFPTDGRSHMGKIPFSFIHSIDRSPSPVVRASIVVVVSSRIQVVYGVQLVHVLVKVHLRKER